VRHMSVSAARAMFEQANGDAAPPPRPPPGAPPRPAGGAGGAQVEVFTLNLDENTKRPRAVSCLAVNRDGTLVAYSPNNHEVHIAEFTVSGFNTIKVLKEHDQVVTSVDWAHNSDRIVTCSQDRNAYVWDGDRVQGWKPTLVHLRINRAATQVKWCHSERKFAVASGQNKIAVCYYEEENNWWVSKLIEDAFQSTVLTVAWHKSDIVLAAGSCDGTVRLFAAAVKGVDSKPAPIFGPDVSFKKLGTEICKVRVNAWVHDMAFSPSSDMLAFSTHDSCVNFLPIAEGSAPSPEGVVRVKCSGLPHQRVLFVSNDRLLAAGHDCNPCLFARKGTQWIEALKIDDESSGKKDDGITSARSAAFKKFEVATTQGSFSSGSSTVAAVVATAHQVPLSSYPSPSLPSSPSSNSPFLPPRPSRPDADRTLFSPLPPPHHQQSLERLLCPLQRPPSDTSAWHLARVLSSLL
jgi:actin related protein 2/3 complex subunit 1A/1B